MGSVERGRDGQPAAIECAIWLELPDDFIVGNEVVEVGKHEGDLGRLLATALAQPLAGPPRRPARIRVASAVLAAEVRSAIGLSIPVEVAPTPELALLRESMERFFDEYDRDEGEPRRIPASPRAGRNDPCPCGSGRKYKRCHLADDRAQAERDASFDRNHRIDNELVARLGDWATDRFADEWERGLATFVDPVQAIQLAAPWSVYCMHVEGQPVSEWYLAERGRKLGEQERAWMVLQREVWLSIWEVTAVEPGASLVLRDLLSGEVRQVREILGSQTLVRRDCVLGRVVPAAGMSIVCGMHPRALPPIEAADLVRRARAKLRCRGTVPVERLRDEKLGRYLIRRWEDALAELDVRSAMPLDLRNTDGDRFLITVDHFAFALGHEEEVAARLATLAGARPPDPDDDARAWTFVRPEPEQDAARQRSIVGKAWFEGRALHLETTSIERADALRARVESACAGLLRHRLRDHTDPLSSAAPPYDEPTREPSPEERQLVLDFKEQHYATWPDEKLPALGGRTPREAVRTAAGRAELDVLLRQMENHELRISGDAPFDFTALRKLLGLDV